MADLNRSISASLRFIEVAAAARARTRDPRVVDYRSARQGKSEVLTSEPLEREIHDARLETERPSLDECGFTLETIPTDVTDWFDTDQVMGRYYSECVVAAQELTGATHAFTFDHLIREPGSQTAGGGTTRDVATTGPDHGGGYVSGVHMDYTDRAEWAEYLALYGLTEPTNAERVVVLNFWRPILNVVTNNHLAVCDARTISASDLVETTIFGYGHAGYSWHDIGVSVYEVAASDSHRWFYFPNMTPAETLVFKTYDSNGVVGRSCPHASFLDTAAEKDTPARRSIELRVLCYFSP